MALRNKNPNPFDRAAPHPAEVKVIVTPGAVESAWPEEIDLLASIASFDFLTVSVLTDDAMIAAKLEAAGCIIAGIVDEPRDVIAYKETTTTTEMSAWFSSPQMAAVFGRGNADLPSHRWIDKVFSKDRGGREAVNYDYVVVCADSHAEHVVRSNDRRVCTMQQLFAELRLVQIAQNNFETEPHTFVNKGLYYLYRRHVMFPEVLRARLTGAHGIGDRIHSLGQRVDFACRACDLVSIASLRTPDNDTSDEALFSIGYLFMLATGAHDDIAAICNNVYSLGLPPMKIALRRGATTRTSMFRRKIATAAPAISTFLDRPLTDAAIESLYPVRDALQHREFLRTIGGDNVGGPNGVFIPESCAELLAQFAPGVLRRGAWHRDLGYMVHYRPLALAVLRALQHVVNGVLPLIVAPGTPAPVTSQHQAMRDELLARLERGPASFLQIWRPALLL
jgi:hypothetical protein